MELQAAITEFQTHLSVARSAATAKTYGVALTHLAAYGTMGGVESVAEVNPGHFLAYLGGKSPVTLASYLTALSQFGEFCHDEGILTNGDYLQFKRRLKRVRGRAPERKIPQVPPEAAFQAILAEAHKDTGGTIRQNLGRLRDIALVETLRSTGCRAAEAVSLRRRHLNGAQATITGKGNKMRTIFFDQAAQDAIETYLALRGDTNPDNPVFARHDRLAKGILPISTTTVRNTIDRLAEAAGIDPKSISPHKLRHRFATKILGATGNLAATQDFLGHSSPATTRIYAKLANDQLAGLHGSVSL